MEQTDQQVEQLSEKSFDIFEMINNLLDQTLGIFGMFQF